MTTRCGRYLGASVVLLVASASAQGQGAVARGIIDGLVSDTSLAPIREAVVSIDGMNPSVLTAADIERRDSPAVSDLLTALTGVGIEGGTRAVNRRYGVMRSCPFQVFIDDVMVPTPNLRDDTLFSSRDLAGIEVYTSIASVPLRYKSAGNGAACGVILLWTKRGGL